MSVTQRILRQFRILEVTVLNYDLRKELHYCINNWNTNQQRRQINADALRVTRGKHVSLRVKYTLYKETSLFKSV